MNHYIRFLYLHLLVFAIFLWPLSLKAENYLDKTVFVGIIIQNQDQLMSYFLQTIAKLDYEKKLMQLQFTICNPSKKVEQAILDWVNTYYKQYQSIEIKIDEITTINRIEKNRTLASIKDSFLKKASAAKQDYCFILSSEVFLLPRTLSYLITKNKPIIAPLLRSIPEPADPFRNFFGDITENGYYKHHDDYYPIAYRQKLGTFQVPCVHYAYLIDTKKSELLSFSKNFTDWDFLAFSKNARQHAIDQFICNEREFGFFLHFLKEMSPEEERVFDLIGSNLEVNYLILKTLLSKHFLDDPHLKEYVDHFNFSDYAMYRVKNRDLFYVDEVNDYIKNYIIKQGLSWEEHIHEEFKKYVKPGTVAIDIGGHIGTHTLNFSRLVGDKGKVYVFEPQAKMFCELAINMYLNQCRNVEMFHNALGNEEKWIEIFIPPEAWKKQFGDDLVNEGHGTVTESTENFTGDRAKMIRLDQLNLNNVSFIKMDVEGFEMEVVRGGIETIKRNQPVMIVEIFQNEERYKKIKTIEDLGYMSLHLSGDDFIFFPSSLLERQRDFSKRNVLFSSPSHKNIQRPIRVAWDGSFLDLGSLSNVNRCMTKEIEKIPNIQLTRVREKSHDSKLPSEFEAIALQIKLTPEHETEVTVRHEWPPNWHSPQGKWVLIQPWEYGAIPNEWMGPLKNVDEIWVPTTFVKNEYMDSGISEEKIKIVPNGYDPEKFHPNIAPCKLPTNKKFKFLFIGGMIPRKGSDILLASYLKAFNADDDVCLIIKDLGEKGPYAGQTSQAQIEDAQKQANAPEILYINHEMTTNQIASLYKACDCFVLPYRGEGFALPVLEAMACGLPVVVTSGGATDDFVTNQSGWFIPSYRVSIGNKIGQVALVKEGWWLEPDKTVLSALLRRIASHPEEAKKKGEHASRDAQNWTWEKASLIAAERLFDLTSHDIVD